MSLTIVFSGRRGVLEKACRILDRQGIPCRMTHPRREEGHVRVPADAADHARRLLTGLPEGRVISASEAARFTCPACGAVLSGGELYCPRCQACIGDPHGT